MSQLHLRIFDGTRQPFPLPAQFLITITDGYHKTQIRDTFVQNDILFDLPFFDNFGDQYTVLVWAKSYKEPLFEKYARLALKAASELADFQSPKFAPVHAAAPPPENRAPIKKRFTLSIFDHQGRPAPRHIHVKSSRTFDANPNCSSGPNGDEKLQLAAARNIVAERYPDLPPLWQGERFQHERIRLGYISSDFCQHPVPLLITRLIELHDRSRFEVLGFSTGLNDQSPIRARIGGAGRCDRRRGRRDDFRPSRSGIMRVAVLAIPGDQIGRC